MRVIKMMLAWLFLSTAGTARAADRFPRPQFETDYSLPSIEVPVPVHAGMEWFETALLAVALAVSAWIALRVRRRRVMWIFMVACLAYFGFWRKGCVCPVGSLQNVSAAVADAAFPLSLPVLLIFMLPLLTALFAGRVFCGSVCPLGAIQDAVIYRPVKLPLWLGVVLEAFAYAYLAVAVLAAVLGAGFIICRFDPFVGLFRMAGPWQMILTGAVFLAAGMFIARPYCRFLCPYGVLLRLLSMLSWKHISITPDSCIDCRLCEGSCPFGAINGPAPERSDESRADAVRRMGLSILLVPLLAAAGALAGRGFAGQISLLHPEVRLAERLVLEAADPSRAATVESDAFRASKVPLERLAEKTVLLRKQFRAGSAAAGGFVGGMLGFQLMVLSLRRRRAGYEPDSGRCFSCARCVEYCPMEHAARKRGAA